MDRGACCAALYGFTQSQTGLKRLSSRYLSRGYHYPKLGIYHSFTDTCVCSFYTFATYSCISKETITLLHMLFCFVL